MEKVLIIDGNNLLFQMFYGMPSKIYNKSGKTIHATIGFISATLRLIKMIDATRVIVVFDQDGSQEREELYQDYKGNRENNWDELQPDEVPFNEEENIKKCLDYLNIKCLYSKNMEADDLIASLAYLYSDINKVYVCSYDSDFFQLINENISIIKYKGKNSKIIDNHTFIEMFNFSSNKYVFYKSLVGDSADNIKGISQIGQKRASKIVSTFENFEEFLENRNVLFSEKLSEVVINEKEKYYLNERMIKLTYKDEIDYNLNDFIFDKDKINETNSQILSINKVFD